MILQGSRNLEDNRANCWQVCTLGESVVHIYLEKLSATNKHNFKDYVTTDLSKIMALILLQRRSYFHNSSSVKKLYSNAFQ
jgi:hypothetical protein